MTKLQDFLNSTITRATGGRINTKGGDLFGVEIECEGRNIAFTADDARHLITKDWVPHNDGSLRAIHGSCQEWVFNGPVNLKRTKDRITKLFDFFKEKNGKLVCSNRTSIHVHFNMSDKHVYQVYNLFILFTIFEGLLDRYCGDMRNGNLFCLSSRYAERQVNWMEEAAFQHFSFGGFREENRYCALNVASINKFGTVEFRGMRLLETEEEVLKWIDIVNELCLYACYTMKNPVDIIEGISHKTPMKFLKEVFKEKSFEELTKGLDEAVIEQSIVDGIRLVQMMCYRIGTEFDAVRLIGRDYWASFKEYDEPDVEEVAPPKEKRRAPPAFRFAPERPVDVDALARRMEEVNLVIAQQNRAQQVRAADRANPFGDNWDIQAFANVDEVVQLQPPAPRPQDINPEDDAGF